MAKTIIKLPDDFYKKAAKLETETKRVLAAGLEAGGEVMEGAVRSNLNSVIDNDTEYTSRTTGELLASLRCAPVKVDRKGIHNTKVGFNEPPKKRKGGGKGGSGGNAIIANVLEYGKGGRKKGDGQPPKPFLTPAKKTHGEKCKAVIIETLSEEFRKVLE